MANHTTVKQVKVYNPDDVTSAHPWMTQNNVPTQLRDFMDALSAKMRGVKFLVRAAHEVYVYMDSCPYTLGYIGYADYSGGRKYAIYSRTIENGKFRPGNKARNMLMSTNIAVAVRNALTHLRPYSIAELAAADIDKLRAAHNTLGNDLRNQKEKARRFLIEQLALTTELRELVRNGHKFVDATFADEAVAFVEAGDHLRVMDSQETRHVFVRVTEDWRGQVFQMQNLAPCKGAYAYEMQIDKTAEHTEAPIAEVPEIILGRVSVLSMLGMEGYVAGVGMKLTESTFYVQL